MKRSYRGALAKEPTEMFSCCHMTKKELSQALGVDRGTIKNWDDIAFYRIPDYKVSYPKKEDGSADREAPLSPYQVWTLSLIGRYMTTMRRAERVKLEIKSRPHRFSLNQFQMKFVEIYVQGETA